MKSPAENVIFINRMPEETGKSKNPVLAKWLKRFGVAGFMFFLIKGLIWLAIFIGAAYFGWEIFE